MVGETSAARSPGREPLANRLEFLWTLYGEEAPGFLVLWRKRDRRSRWIAADRLEETLAIQSDEEVYFGVALQNQERALALARTDDPAQTRGTSESVIGVPGVWADIDVRGDAHQRGDLPPSFDAAHELAASFPLAPTLVVHSGHGLQVYWLFKEPWLVEEASERAQAQRLSRRFQATLQESATSRGWSVDDTSDLARVLRLPETFNTKVGERRPVEVVGWHPEHQYDPAEIERYLVEDVPSGAASSKPSGVDTEAILAGVPKGQRDKKLFRLASKLRRSDVPRDVAERLVLEAAHNCAPPFPDKEARAKVASAYDRYPPGPSEAPSLAGLAALAGEPPRPLHRDLPPASPFPTKALGEVLGPAAIAIQEKTQSPDAICAQGVLAAATLGVQALADVELPTGALRPVSSFFLSVASTGERKTSADSCATAPVHERERRLAEIYARDFQSHEIELAVWEQERAQVLRNKKLPPEMKRAALETLGPRPSGPLVPLLTCQEPTFEGLVKLFAEGLPSLGVFSTEGGQFIGGHGMNQDNRLKTAAALSGLWDGEPLKRVRAGEALANLPGRRLALHLLVQPGVAAELLSDALLADQGLLSRILVAAPDAAVGTRFWREMSDEGDQDLRRYHEQLARILSRPLPLAKGTRNELEPKTLPLSALARDLWIRFADHVEGQMKAGGEYESIRGLANKLPEHATRLAAVIALFHDPALRELSEEQLARGIELAKFYANEALRLFEAGALDPDLALAKRLLRWLQESWTEEIVSLPDVYQRGPRAIRDQGRARKLVRILQDHGWLEVIPEGAEVAGTKRREVWRIVAP
jgi:hypothetical protein